MPEQCHQPKAMSLERADDGQDSGGTNWWGEGPEEDSAAPTMGGVSSRALWGQGMSRELLIPKHHWKRTAQPGSASLDWEMSRK